MVFYYTTKKQLCGKVRKFIYPDRGYIIIVTELRNLRCSGRQDVRGGQEMDGQKFKGKEDDLLILDMESLDQVAGGNGELKVVCLHCGSTNTVRVNRSSGNPLKSQMPWVWKCLDCGLTEDEWI